jgi:Flp pilus assembly protein TadB
MEDEGESAKIVQLLEEIRDNQRLQLERQAEAISLQKQQRELVDSRMAQATSLQDRAERLEERKSRALKVFRIFIFSVLSIVGLLLILVAWITFETR